MPSWKNLGQHAPKNAPQPIMLWALKLQCTMEKAGQVCPKIVWVGIGYSPLWFKLLDMHAIYMSEGWCLVQARMVVSGKGQNGGAGGGMSAGALYGLERRYLISNKEKNNQYKVLTWRNNPLYFGGRLFHFEFVRGAEWKSVMHDWILSKGT